MILQQSCAKEIHLVEGGSRKLRPETQSAWKVIATVGRCGGSRKSRASDGEVGMNFLRD